MEDIPFPRCCAVGRGGSEADGEGAIYNEVPTRHLTHNLYRTSYTSSYTYGLARGKNPIRQRVALPPSPGKGYRYTA